ncbi:MAG: DUF1592 domain-containing protein [Planctomycetaceae bacterium]
MALNDTHKHSTRCGGFRFRGQLGLEERTLAELAAAEGVEERFAEYLWSVFNSDVQSFPTSEIISAWKELPAPASDDIEFQKNVRKKCQELFQKLDDWHSRLGINSDNKEDAPVIRTETFTLSPTQAFDMNINWPEGTQTAHIQLLVESANGDENTNPGVIWHKPTLSFNTPDAPAKPAELLRRVLSQEDLDRLGFGTHPHGGTIGPDDFVTLANEPRTFRLQIPEGARSARLSLTAELDDTFGEDSIVRCSITQREETDQGKSLSALLANSERPGFDRWRAGVLEFAKLLPPISHREPAPSDRDPIPPPFDGSYNNPERNHFHVRIKYHRDDQFLVDNILDNKTREELDHAWSDLLGSFEYHDAWLQFVSDKFGLDLNGRRVATLDPAWIENLPQEPREYVQNLHREYKVIQKSFRSAEVGHVEDMLEFASRAWRRQLKDEEKVRLRSFYDESRTDSALQHDAAIRVLLTRILLAPDFLYRAERSSESDDEVPLSDWELVSRLSYFLWSSLPDTELRNIAASGELTDPDVLVAQTRRMLSDNKSRRFATEFFGQWFGFYRFNNYSGIDPQRFPEFTETLKSAMYDEAILFFDHIVREDRPVQEILSADYSFLNQDLAEHYGVDIDVALSDRFERVERANHFDRGGVLSLGAVLTLTSAPLRTSPVKRGDWVLRRVLGTPVPPPPPDVGSISSDDQPGDGLSVRERLEAHRREESCANCHSRIDPLGFALEQFDPIGRLRREYRNGTEIDTSGILRDGTEIDDFAALNEYVVSQRDLFYENLCTKLLGYALGRSVMIGDTFLIEEMMADLKSGAGMSKLVERIVNSRQFRYCGTRD